LINAFEIVKLDTKNWSIKMKATDLRQLTLSIVKGEKTEVSQREQNVSAAFIKELVSGSADLHDAIYADSVIIKEVEGNIYVLTTDGKTFAPFDDSLGEPKIGCDNYYLNEEIDSIGEIYARVVTIAEALACEPAASPAL
jgi:hypothetical protein